MSSTLVVAKAVICNADGNILILQRSEDDIRRPLQWDLPGGWAEENEEFRAAASREILEETGINIAAENIKLSYTFTAIRDHGNVCWLCFVATTNCTEVRLSKEHIACSWESIKTAQEKIEYPIQKDMLEYLINNNLI